MSDSNRIRPFIRLRERSKQKPAPAPVHRVTLFIAIAGLTLSVFNVVVAMRTSQSEARLALMREVYVREWQARYHILFSQLIRDQIQRRLDLNLPPDRRIEAEARMAKAQLVWKQRQRNWSYWRQWRDKLKWWRSWWLDEEQMREQAMQIQITQSDHDAELAYYRALVGKETAISDQWVSEARQRSAAELAKLDAEQPRLASGEPVRGRRTRSTQTPLPAGPQTMRPQPEEPFFLDMGH